MSLDTMPNDILLTMFKSLYPPGFFSNFDWQAAYCLDDEGNSDDEDKGQSEVEGQEEEDDEGGEDNEDDDTDLNNDECEDGDEYEDEEDLETSSSSSSHDFRVAREIAAWEHVNEADEAMKSLSQICRQLRATS